MQGERIFACLCGVYLLGIDVTYDQHLQFDCPVYAEAYRVLSEKYGNRIQE